MRAKCLMTLTAAFMMTLRVSELSAQKEFADAHQKLSEFLGRSSSRINDPAGRDKYLKELPSLTGAINTQMTSGILSYLNTTTTLSVNKLTLKIARALADHSFPAPGLAQADGEVSIVPVPHQNAYAIAYDIGTCASCTTSWVEIAALRDDHWVITDHLDNPATNDAIHLAWVGPESSLLLAVYGIHWGDPHNGLDVRLYSVDNGFKQVWSSLNISQGEIAIQGDQMTLKYWTAPTPWADTTKPFGKERQVFQVDGQQVKLLETKFSKLQQ